MKDLKEILDTAIVNSASDVLITVGVPVAFRITGSYTFKDDEVLTPEVALSLAEEVLGERFAELDALKEIDTSLEAGDRFFRVNVFRQQGYCALSVRLLSGRIYSFEELGLTPPVKRACEYENGLILITGATGQGKSTTMAAMVDYINSTRNCHIVTIEDPVEFRFRHKRSIISQKQVGKDTNAFSTALRAVLREDPDVIVVGEMRDLETIRLALTAAETGHLVISTLHTGSAVTTVDRLIDSFPENQQMQVRSQLTMVLKAIFAQRLIPDKQNRRRYLALEVALFNPAMQNLIRTGKTHMISSQIALSTSMGMQTFEQAEKALRDKGLIF